MPNSAQSLTSRDLTILRMVYEYEGCMVEHLRRRFFPTPGARTPCYRRIAYLVEHGYLTSSRLPSQTGTGSGKASLTVGPNARPILAEMLGLSRSDLARTRLSSPMFIAHHLAICDVRLAFEMAVGNSTIFHLQDWTGDRELHQSPIRAKDPKTAKELPIIPDAAFTLTLPDGSQQSFFIEMDMDTVSPKRMQAKLRAYLIRKGDPTPVLFVVPNDARQSAITHWAETEARDLKADPTIFWIATKAVITEETVLSAPIWQVVGGPEALALQSLACEPSQPFRGDGFASAQTLNGNGGLFS